MIIVYISCFPVPICTTDSVDHCFGSVLQASKAEEEARKGVQGGLDTAGVT